MRRRHIVSAFLGVGGSLALHGGIVFLGWLVQHWLSTPWFVWNSLPKKQTASNEVLVVSILPSVSQKEGQFPPAEANSSSFRTSSHLLHKEKLSPTNPVVPLTPEQLPLRQVPTLLKGKEEGITMQLQMDLRFLRRWQHITALQSFLEHLIDVENLAQKARFQNAKEMLHTVLQNADALLVNSTDPTDPDAVAFFVVHPPSIPPFVPLGPKSENAQVHPAPKEKKIDADSSLLLRPSSDKSHKLLWAYILEPGFFAASSRSTWHEEAKQLQKQNVHQLHEAMLRRSEMVSLHVYNPKEHWLFYLLQPKYAVTATEVQASLIMREEILFRAKWIFSTEEKAQFFMEVILPVLRTGGTQGDSLVERVQRKVQWKALQSLFPEVIKIVGQITTFRIGKTVECVGIIPAEAIQNILHEGQSFLQLKNLTIPDAF